jgi:hypothetical protein
VIPTAPGIGSDLNEDFILKRPPKPQDQLASWIGSYW